MNLSFLQAIPDVLFPKSCYGCKAPNTYLCDPCAQQCILREPQCPHCATRIPFGNLLPHCRKQIHLNRLFLAMDYNNDVVRHLIHDFKYKHCFALAVPLTMPAIQWLTTQQMLRDKDTSNTVIVPVPGHPRRTGKRGFHPALKIAEIISAQLDIPIAQNALIKTKNTRQQAKTKQKEERYANVKNVFATQNVSPILQKTVLLVDDVYTTGATMAECSRILKNAGVKNVMGLAIAKD